MTFLWAASTILSEASKRFHSTNLCEFNLLLNHGWLRVTHPSGNATAMSIIRISRTMCNNGEVPLTIPMRFTEVFGFEERKNDVIYGRPLVDARQSRIVVFFPGDVQDYVENMEAHRDNRHHKQWNLVDTAMKLQKKFPENHVLVVKPSRMDFKTFSCFQNFVKSNQLGVPDHTLNYNALEHLHNLIKGVSERLITDRKQSDEEKDTISNNDTNKVDVNLAALDLEMIGFSKGCVVLNQFIYEFHNFNVIEKNEDILSIIHRVKDMYWLDGGHSGGKNTWVNDKGILATLSSLGINIHIHVTPYQIQDDRRPWIKKEEKSFSDYLQKHGCKIDRTVHFEAIPPSITTHFDVINAFKTNAID